MEREEEVVYLHLDDIIPNRFQPREVFDERPLKELAVSIKEHGVIQPIIVRRVNDKYEIIAGERRYKASALAGLTKIPAIVRDLDDKETSKVALLENLQRKNLNPLEEAKTYQKILEIDQMTQEELAKTMGKSQSAVANKLRLLSLPDEIQEALLKEKISERHARSLLNLGSIEEQKEMLKKIVENKMTVKQVEEEIKGKINKGEESDTIETMNNGQQLVEKSEPKLLENDNQSIPTAENYIPVNPIMPNFNGENDESNTPILTNIPTFESGNEESEKSEEENKPKFINFGELNKSSEEVEDDDVSGTMDANAGINIDINEIKENATDINSSSVNNNSGFGLDSLLNLNQTQGEQSIEKAVEDEKEFKFFSPAQEAIKESEEEPILENSEDYFKAPEIISINTDKSENNDTLLENINDEPSLEITNNNDSLKEAVEIIRDALTKIESLGLKIDKDEMNLEKSYQVVIKIEK